MKFRHQGIEYVVIRTKDLQFNVLVNGRLIKSPMKPVLRKARLMMASLDVDDVHNL